MEIKDTDMKRTEEEKDKEGGGWRRGESKGDGVYKEGNRMGWGGLIHRGRDD